MLSSPYISWSRVHVSFVCFLYPFPWSIAAIFNAFFFRLGYINTVADEFSSVLSILPCIQNAPERISTHIHLKNFRGGMPPDPPRKLVAFGHSSGLLPQNDKSKIKPWFLSFLMVDNKTASNKVCLWLFKTGKTASESDREPQFKKD